MILNFAGNHNGGEVKFGTDGYLYASIGDGGCDYAGDSVCGGANDASRDRNILNGKILRIAKDGSLPPDNMTYARGGQVRRVDPPPDATAVAANVTITNATASGSLRISLAGTTPTLDTIAFRPGVTRANNAILGLFGTPAGNVTVASGFAVGTADLVIDVTGWRR